MGLGMCMGAIASCPMGVAPTPLIFLPTAMLLGSAGPMGAITNCVPFMNIIPFGVCKSPANPITAALTAAALGVPTPGPCIPTPAGTWIPMKPTVLTKCGPILNNDSMLMCAYCGVIKVNMPAQFTVMV